jgi:UPF0716 protein FxsA
VLLPLVLIFLVVPIAELWLIIQVGEAIGIWWTLALLIADSVLGSLLMRAQGRAAWRRFNDATTAGKVPAREVLDGVLVIFGGALLLTPGFISDILGVTLLLPPTRAIVRRLLVRRLGHRMLASIGTPPPRTGRGPATWSARRPADFDVEGSAVDLDADALDPPAHNGTAR